MPSMQQLQKAREKREAREDRIACDIIEECRTQLMLKFRFMDIALWRMELVPSREEMRYPMTCDAEKIFIDPPRIISRFNASYEDTVRDYLHLIMHCIFRHPFEKNFRNKEAWWLACDILVESTALDMIGGRFACPEDNERRQAISELKMACGKLLPARLYHLIDDVLRSPANSSMGITAQRIRDYHALFERDNHEAWPASASDAPGEEQPGEIQDLAEQADPNDEDDSSLESGGPVDENDMEQQIENVQQMEGGDDTDTPEDDTSSDVADGGDEAVDESPEGDDMSGTPQPMDEAAQRDADREHQEKMEKLEREWKDISKEIEMGLETFSKEWGDEAGSFMTRLRIANRKIYDYADFLRRFTHSNEALKMNPDEFDYIYYTYGMNLYGNIPLIEPLEYKDQDIIRDFVIAIDTSESTSGDLVKTFLQHTFSILKKSEAYSREVNIRIIQCDSKVQADTKITNVNQVDEIMENFTLRGFGGTDFRPLFAYVERLRARGDLQDLKGLLYFTDGLGQFPDEMPEYEVAFVFMDDGARILPPVPPWAMKVVLDEQGINALKSEKL